MKSIDARGLSCPQPMLMAKKAMETGSGENIEVLVDNEASIENISRAAKQLGWQVNVSSSGDEARLELTKK